MEGVGAAAGAAVAIDHGTYRPTRLTLQWHITEACNLTCRHCYQEPQRHTPSFTELLDALEQFRRLLHHYRTTQPKQVLRAHINLTGGEPFSHPQIFHLLDRLHAHRQEFSFALLSNGSYLDSETTERLALLKPRFVQLSLEGSDSTHDAIRGAGDHQRVCRAIRTLKQENIPVLLSFTAQQCNFREFPQVAKLGRKYGVRRVWADRFIPLGSAAREREQVLSPDETREFCTIMKQTQRSWKRFSKTEIAMHRALQFLIGDCRPYRCHAGGELITLMANGDLVPCRRMPLTVGNLQHTPLLELYRTAPLLNELRAPHPQEHPCHPCPYSAACRGGLRCLSHAVNGSWNTRDPGCWRDLSTSL